MATCLVTGGAGFLGSHLCDELLRRDHRVICVDNFETGSLVNIEHIRDPAFVHLNVDITETYFVDEPVDYVYHLASPASPIDTCDCRCTRSRSAPTGRTTRSVSQKRIARASCSRRRARSTAIPRSTPNAKATGVT